MGIGPEPRPGPYEAVREFLAEQDRFEIDRSREKFFMTQNLSGYLRCIADRRSARAAPAQLLS